ncbi:type VI secretion system contractile sheath domain-containing protein [Vibrio tapetis]|nr:type VI secretion system contractile sheath large subunit [Vibrio tapetis]
MQIPTNWQQTFTALDNKDNAFLKEALSLFLELDKKSLNNRGLLLATIAKLIAEIDLRLTKQLDTIIQDDDFQRLERNWLSLKGLATLPINYQRIRLKILDMSWHEISADVNQAYNIKSSELFNKIGNQELNTLGGHPFGCITFAHRISMDIGIDSDYDDLFTLELLGKLGEVTLCPMLFSPNSQFFANTGADWISDIDRIEKILSGPDYQAWQALRNKPCARFIGLVMPFVRLRAPYHNFKSGFIYNESGQGLWGNAVFPFVSTIMREYQRINWFGFLKSRWNDKYQGAVVNLPNHPIAAHYIQAPEADIPLFGQLSSFYAQNGFIPLTKSPLTDKYYFNGNNSIWQHQNIDKEQVLTQVQTSLMSCRIAHYLKVQVREMIGSFNTATECEVYLTQWIENFSSNVALANEETLAKYPLSFAKITVNESSHHPGSFVCTLRIVPQYQYDHFSGEVILTTELDEVA